MKNTENYEKLLERFYKRTTQLEDRQSDLEDAYQEFKVNKRYYTTILLTASVAFTYWQR